MIGPRALELRRHLRGDHRHGFGLRQLPLLDEALQPQRPRRVDEHDAVELVDETRLEEQGNVADDDAIAAPGRFIDQRFALTLDLGMDDAVELLQLLVIMKDQGAQRGTIEQAVRAQYRRPPLLYDLVVPWRPPFDGAPGENVGV